MELLPILLLGIELSSKYFAKDAKINRTLAKVSQRDCNVLYSYYYILEYIYFWVIKCLYLMFVYYDTFSFVKYLCIIKILLGSIIFKHSKYVS